MIIKRDSIAVVSEIDLTLSPKGNRGKLMIALPYYQNMKWEKIIFKPDFPKYDVYETQTYCNIVNAYKSSLY